MRPGCQAVLYFGYFFLISFFKKNISEITRFNKRKMGKAVAYHYLGIVIFGDKSKLQPKL